jgi:type III restriction enzyme
MEFKFDAQQEYQIHAIEAVAGLLEGQPRNEIDVTFSLSGLAAVPNILNLSEQTLLQNLHAVQEQNKISLDDALLCIEADIETADGVQRVRFSNFSIEMETGTGKTYVYIRTALELFRRYGLSKYIVVVPSVAVREGVLKTLQITEKHLRALYENIPYRYYTYDSGNLAQVRQFALSDSIEFMVMTIDSFNKASNVINQSTDRLQGETPIHLIQAARPILILDEPQNMESELRVKALSALHPLFALRYSATHRNPYNLIYRLTPFEAYRQGLVKRIEVASVVQENDANQVYLKLINTTTERKKVTAQIAVHKLMKDGTVKEQAVTVKVGDSLEDKTGRIDYQGYEVSEINPGLDMVIFSNGVEIGVGETRGADKESVFKAQIHYTVEEHFRRQLRLRPSGIKVLSLFFIDKVDNYALEDGIIRRLFKTAFEEVRAEYTQRDPEWQDKATESVQGAYFAQRKVKGEVIFEDSKTGESEKDKDAYDLILKDKERLLSLHEPTSFIFSHSALREGWDNPNVFQICTLNQTASEVKKRQEIGRGVRLAVNQTGERIHDEKINVLTVVANESYERYVERLQSEIVEEYGIEGLPPKPANARQRGVAQLRKEFTLRPEFKELWERIKYHTRYSVSIDTEALITDVLQVLDQVEITAPQIAITRARVEVEEDDRLEAITLALPKKEAINLSGRILPNVIDIMDNLMEYTTPPVSLTRGTLLEIFRRSSNKQAALVNPHAYATEAVRIIKSKLVDQLVSGIKYEKMNDWYEMTRLDEQIESWEEYLIPAAHSVYDQVIYDSEVEKAFVEGLERRDDVKLYLKLPRWFTVSTPVGNYNPDWAIVMEERDAFGEPTDKSLLYLVRETKDTKHVDELPPEERRKVLCGKSHFQEALGVNYRVVTTSDQLL